MQKNSFRLIDTRPPNEALRIKTGKQDVAEYFFKHIFHSSNTALEIEALVDDIEQRTRMCFG